MAGAAPGLTPEQRDEARAIYRAGGMTQAMIAAHFSVSQSHIWKACKGVIRPRIDKSPGGQVKPLTEREVVRDDTGRIVLTVSHGEGVAYAKAHARALTGRESVTEAIR